MRIATVGLLVLALSCGPLAFLWLVFHRRLPAWGARSGRRVLSLVQPPPEPVGNRPLELIAVDLHRLGLRFHTLHPHTPYAKVQAVSCAYDRALGECCRALGLTHLLGVLGPGPELDAERERVEDRLGDSGVRLPHAA